MDTVNYVPVTTLAGDTMLVNKVFMKSKNISGPFSKKSRFCYDLMVGDMTLFQCRIARSYDRNDEVLLGLRELITARLQKLARTECDGLDLRERYEYCDYAPDSKQKCNVRLKSSPNNKSE